MKKFDLGCNCSYLASQKLKKKKLMETTSIRHPVTSLIVYGRVVGQPTSDLFKRISI